MDIINAVVMHKSFGEGTVLTQDNGRVTVQFASKTTAFSYPDAFEKFLIAADQNLQSAIAAELAARKAEKEETQRKKTEALAAKQEEQNRSSAKALISEAAERIKRIDGSKMVFFVFQGEAFGKQAHGGYIWAPIYTRGGTHAHHWDRLLDVRKGDIILHGCDAQIKALSIAKGECYESPQPEELMKSDEYEREGRRVDCDYMLLANPIRTADFREDIIRLSQAKYSAFDKDGNGNMGYLYALNGELAQMFIRAAVEKNPELAALNL